MTELLWPAFRDADFAQHADVRGYGAAGRAAAFTRRAARRVERRRDRKRTSWLRQPPSRRPLDRLRGSVPWTASDAGTAALNDAAASAAVRQSEANLRFVDEAWSARVFASSRLDRAPARCSRPCARGGRDARTASSCGGSHRPGSPAFGALPSIS
jgi:hypothetical protein